ncbi:MAG TPA: hypothetical protein VIA45_09375 [Thermoanaerobaculia bacterium]
MKRARALRTLLPLFTASLVFSCGRKADPTPPLPRGPRAVSDLTVEQEGDEAVLTFSYPDRLLTGAPLTDLAEIDVYRVTSASAMLTAPSGTGAKPGGPPAPRTDEAPGAAARRAAQSVRLAEEAFYREARPVATLPAGALGQYTQGASVVYRDPLMPLLRESAVPVLAWSVVSVRRDGEKSPLSNIVTLTPEVPPAAPELGAVSAEEGKVCLDWTAPSDDMLGRPVAVGGYFVYRRQLPQEEYERPLNAAAVANTSFVDTAVSHGASYFYTVRATALGKPRIEGPPSDEGAIVYRDVYPPAAPARLDALTEANLVRLVWDPSPSPDVAGYMVYRAVDEGPPAPITEKAVTDTFFTDEHVPEGKRSRYTVRAVDGHGNLSPPSPEAVAEPY